MQPQETQQYWQYVQNAGTTIQGIGHGIQAILGLFDSIRSAPNLIYSQGWRIALCEQLDIIERHCCQASLLHPTEPQNGVHGNIIQIVSLMRYARNRILNGIAYRDRGILTEAGEAVGKAATLVLAVSVELKAAVMLAAQKEVDHG